MREEKKTSFAVPTISQYRLLNALVFNEEYYNDARITESIFPNETAKSLYQAICYLIQHNMKITKASLYQTGAQIDYNVTEAIVEKLFSIDEGTDNIDDILQVLKTEKQKEYLSERLDTLRNLVSEPGDLDYTKVIEHLYDMEDFTNVQDVESPLIDLDEWVDDYIEDLEFRKEGRFYSYGDPLLDEVAKKGAYPGAISICAATTSMGKSAFALNLVNSHINMDIPCMYLSLEMSAIDTFDRLVALRCGIPEKELYNLDNANLDAIIERVQEERAELKTHKKFLFSESPNVDIPKLRSLIREFKLKTHEDYCFVVIDLLTQMKNFMSAKNNATTANVMEVAMNDLNALAKDENVHIVGIVQLNRESDAGRPHNIAEIEKLKPSINSVKNSGAIAERARFLFTIFRPKYYADRYLQDDPEAQTMEDIMELTVLKNSSGVTGSRLRYKYQAEYYKCIPVDPEEAKMLEKQSMVNHINY